jgi:hypothetical protein
MELKIITKEEAIRLGLTKESNPVMGKGFLDYHYGVIGKIDKTKGKDDPKRKGKPEHIYRTHIKTGVKEILYESEEYKKLRLKDNNK